MNFSGTIKQLAYYPFDSFLGLKSMYYKTAVEKNLCLLSQPRFLQLEVTTRCNLKCIMCERTYYQSKYLNNDLTFEEFKVIVGQFPKLKNIELTGFGEPLLNKDFEKMLAFVSQKAVISFTSNFNYLPQEIAEDLVSMRVDFITFSIDGATKKTYESIRQGGNFERLIENINQIQKIKRKSGSKKPCLRVNSVISDRNVHECLSIIKLFTSLGISEITLTPVYIFNQTMNILGNGTLNLTEKSGISRNTAFKKPVSLCIFPWLGPYITLEKEVLPCRYSKVNIDRSKCREIALGNISKQSINEIWFSERFNELRRYIKKGIMPPSCKKGGCPLYR
jgi:MoaA/NifB/PqqE/SkfB family radical SAM enzyme